MSESEVQIESSNSNTLQIEGMRRFSHEAMNTTFKIFVIHDNEKFARQVASAVFAEVDRLETELSKFIKNSEISRINNLPANKPLLIGIDAFECIKHSCLMYNQTQGAFDITIGPLMNCWRNRDGSDRTPGEEELSDALSRVGSNLINLNEDDHTIALLKSPMQLDLGAVGKGYAVDRMAEHLRDYGMKTVLISGGFSSVLAVDAPEGKNGWPLSVSNPQDRTQILARPNLLRRSISSSGLLKGRHIIDPHTGKPTQGHYAAWSTAPDAATADALSTAFMNMKPEEIENYCAENEQAGALIMKDPAQGNILDDRIVEFGHWREKVLCQ
jgi:FAD:protein FMN transferase